MADPAVIIPAIELKPKEALVRLGFEGDHPSSHGTQPEVQDGFLIVDFNHLFRAANKKPEFKGHLLINGCVVTGFVIDTSQNDSMGMTLDNGHFYGFPMQPESLQRLADLLYGLGAIPHQVQGTGAEKVITVLQERIKDQKEHIDKLHRLLTEMVADKAVSPEVRTRILTL